MGGATGVGDIVPQLFEPAGYRGYNENDLPGALVSNLCFCGRQFRCVLFSDSENMVTLR
jgi:hypothetical protein